MSRVSRAISDGVDDKRARICSVVDSIPAGRVATYGQVADEAGLPRRARLVGRVLSDLPQGSTLPWHRVLGAGGRIATRGDGRSQRVQARRLRAEGVTFRTPGRVDLEQHGWHP